MASSHILSLLTLFSLLTLSLSSSSSSSSSSAAIHKFSKITIPLSPYAIAKPTTHNLLQRLNHLATSSITRAKHLKNPHKKLKTSIVKTQTPLFPQSYGGYSISLSFGSPPQNLSLIMDTGSSLVWVPCTQTYKCSECNFPNINPNNISAFIPKLSSSARIIGCLNKKCGWIYDDGESSLRCKDCAGKPDNCTQICPPYILQYGSGSTSGLLLSETLNLPNKEVGDFLVGCSLFSTKQPSGIAGFGRGRSSLPVQMGLKRFSYCLVSHRFDDEPVSSDLVLVSGKDSGDGKTKGLNYTPFIKNPLKSNSAFQEYYYVSLRQISVGGRKVKIPYKYLVPGTDGHGGTIVDSGTTFTFMEKSVFDLVAKEFEKQMSNYTRAIDVENESGLRPCFNFTGLETVSFPELVFEFKGGAKMELPLADYFSILDVGILCMTIVTDNVVNLTATGGPSIILGNYQQQNFLVEYDLENDRLGFGNQICNSD